MIGKVSSWPGGPFPQISVVPRSNQIGTHKVAWETWQGVQVENDGSFVLEDLPTSHLVDIRVSHPSDVSEPRLRSVKPMSHTPTRRTGTSAAAEFAWSFPGLRSARRM